MSKEQTPITDKVLDNILFKISICSSNYHKREVLREEINAKVLEALEREFSKIKIKESLADSAGDYIGETSVVFNGKEYYETEVKPKYGNTN